MASVPLLPRGRRAWHVGHWEYAATRDTLRGLSGMRVCRTSDNKARKANVL